MYPAVIDKETFNAVQEHLSKNRYTLGGKETVRVPYLLTGKLFCGHCGTEMVAGGGTRRSGVQYLQYVCKKKRKNECKKTREDKNNLERTVTQFVMDWLSDEKHAKIIVDDVLAYYDKRTDEQNLKSVTARIAKIRKEVSELTEAFVKAKSALLQNSIEEKMSEYEILLSDIETQKAQLELERGFKVTERNMRDFIRTLIRGNPTDEAFQRQLIDNLVYKVFVSDDDTVVLFNLSGGKSMENIDFSDVKPLISGQKTVRTLLPLACQVADYPRG